MMYNVITPEERSFVALRRARRPTAGRSSVYHAVTPHCRMALCTAEPGAGSGWAEPPGKAVTCPACLKRLAKVQPYRVLVCSGSDAAD
jgi:hypothetical protein